MKDFQTDSTDCAKNAHDYPVSAQQNPGDPPVLGEEAAQHKTANGEPTMSISKPDRHTPAQAALQNNYNSPVVTNGRDNNAADTPCATSGDEPAYPFTLAVRGSAEEGWALKGYAWNDQSLSAGDVGCFRKRAQAEEDWALELTMATLMDELDDIDRMLEGPLATAADPVLKALEQAERRLSYHPQTLPGLAMMAWNTADAAHMDSIDRALAAVRQLCPSAQVETVFRETVIPAPSWPQAMVNAAKGAR